MTHPTDEKLDALVRDLRRTQWGQPLPNQAAEALTALRAQLAEVRAQNERLWVANERLVKQLDEASTDIDRIAVEREKYKSACIMHRDKVQELILDVIPEANARADRAEAALAAQIEADAKPALRLSIARKMGMYGSAYDGPFDARAYTYDHQPGNQAVWAIGRAASNATLDKVGDYIDRGLGLLRHLKAEGFGVFALNNNDTHDRTALDRMLRAEREKALREAADAFMDGSAPRMTILALIEQENQK